GKTWTLDDLNAWLFKPQDFAKGTKMTFIGLPKAEDRANVVAYLNSMSDKPLPVADLTKGAATGAPAGGAAQGGEQKQGAAPAHGGQQGGRPRPAPPKGGPPPQAATPAPPNPNSNAPTTTGPSQNNTAAPRTRGAQRGANPSPSPTEGQAK